MSELAPGTFWRLGERTFRVDPWGRARWLADDQPVWLSVDLEDPEVQKRLVKLALVEEST